MKTKAADYRGSLGYKAVFNRNPLLAKELQYRYKMASDAYFLGRNNKLDKSIIPQDLRKYINDEGTNFAGFYGKGFTFHLKAITYNLTPEYKVNQGFWKTLMDPRNFSSKEEQDRYIQKNLIITNPELQKKCYNLWL